MFFNPDTTQPAAYNRLATVKHMTGDRQARTKILDRAEVLVSAPSEYRAHRWAAPKVGNW